MKKKTLAGLISSLICISLIGVGFASWVIVGDDEKSSEAGTITAESVTDNSVTIALEWGSEPNEDNKIHFGSPADSTATGWLRNTEANTDDLTAVLKVTVSNETGLQDITATLAPTPETKSVYDAAINAGVIAAEPTITYGGSGANRTVTITFKYGESFGNKNPYTYYNGLTGSDAQISDKLAGNTTEAKAHAIKYIGELEKLKTVNFVVTVKATSKTA